MKLVTLFFLAAFLVACGGPAAAPRSTRPLATSNKAWYTGGTLHDKTAADWLRATDSNRLATAGDWVTLVAGWDTLDEAKVMAAELSDCVTESAPSAPATMKAADVGAACMVLMGWQRKP